MPRHPPVRTLTGLALCACVAAVFAASPSHAAQETVPVDVGVGPAFYHGVGPAFADAPGHYGLKISLAAIINNALIRKHIKRVPKQYRPMALRMQEFRYRPTALLPDSLLISPKLGATGMYGATWRFIGLGIPLAEGAVNVDLTAGLIVTYAFLHSDNAEFGVGGGTMHFLRPGLDIGPSVEIPITDNFLMSFGWSAQLYIPQPIGAGVFELPTLDAAGLDQSLWFMGQLWLKFHVRFPYTTNI